MTTLFAAAAVVIPHKKLKSDGSSHQSDSAESGPNGGENGSMGGTKHLYSVAIDSVPNHEASMALTNAQLRCGGVPVNATDHPSAAGGEPFTIKSHYGAVPDFLIRSAH